MVKIIAYKLFRVKEESPYSLYVKANIPMEIGVWLSAEVGEKVDDTHVKASGCGGKLSLRPGFHLSKIPEAHWIGKRLPSGELVQRKDTAWFVCEIKGNQLKVTNRNGSRELLDGWYYYKTNSKQDIPWIITRWMRIIRMLTPEEVDAICLENGVTPQRREDDLNDE